MKIGILTFHNAENFGAVLQCYSLQTILQNMGYDVEIIDYRCPKIEMSYDIFNPRILFSMKNIFRSLRIYLNRFSNISDRKTKKQKYVDFRNKYLILSDRVKSCPKDDYDAVIVGSDQVWNFGLTNGINNFYTLNFSLKPNAKRISYAASSEIKICNDIKNGKYNISEPLKKFDAISVRENELKEALDSVLKGCKIEVHLDPVFLLGSNDFERIAIAPQEKKYILIYHLYESPEAAALADDLSEKNNKQVIEIHAAIQKRKTERHKYGLGPLEILGYIQYADIVFTTSFHGLALSIILEKDVWAFNSGLNTRQQNILSKFGMSKRLINTKADYDSNNVIDYQLVKQIITDEENRSCDYLDKNLRC